ncbi:MAG: AmmeMemoRadiSam system radical SAM enzyme [Candidatus Zapsychrus exili]|nr:AmmeMemoRadiSam system radical SAM enzyme [Candidatus Zapsychrus exili]
MNTVQCELCPRRCRLKNGERGNCRVRINLDGELKSLVYGNPCSIHVDPIEKKPLYHFLPTSTALSIATAGCNLHCKYCQNWQISQRPPEELQNEKLSTKDVVDAALKNNCKSIAYTYSDPVVFYEYTLETSKVARQYNIKNVLVTAAYINEKPLLELCKYTDAANIDLKGITEEYYKNMSEATLAPVLAAIKIMQKQGIWIELTNLIVPTFNDNEKDIANLCKWIIDNVGPDVPLHFSRFWPMHKLKNLFPTPVETLTLARDIAKQIGINHVYIGNVGGEAGNDTHCPQCKKTLIKRRGYMILENNITNNQCKFCKNNIAGIWN